MGTVESRSYLAEVYAPRSEFAGLQARVEELRSASEARSRGGDPVRHLQAVFLPGEETCLHLFEARSLESVQRVLADAGVEADRIAEAVASPELARRRRAS